MSIPAGPGSQPPTQGPESPRDDSEASINDHVLANDTHVGVARRAGGRFGPWAPHFVAVVAATVVAFIWAAKGASGGEGLMWLGDFAGRFSSAFARAAALAVLVVIIANKLVSMAPKAVPWVEPPEETIDGHYTAAWLAAFLLPFVIGAVFGVLPLAVVEWSLGERVEVWPGDGVLTAVGASMLLVPRLGGALMRKIDVLVHARLPPDEPLEPLEPIES